MKSDSLIKEPENKGAPAVLEVSSQWEMEARQDVMELTKKLRETQARQIEERPEDDGKDWPKTLSILRGQLKDAEDRWKRCADMVHKFDRTVDPSKRSAEETITREEGAKAFSMFTLYVRTVVEHFKVAIVPRIRESATNEEGYAIIDASLSEEFENKMTEAVDNLHLPSWAKEAVKGAL